jgi:hypothetical protein
MESITHSRKELRHHVSDLLSSLGNDAAEVARRLEEAAVRGTPRDAEKCAIAVYVSSILGADPAVSALKVTGTSVVISPARRWRTPIAVRLPGPLRTFIAGFDHDAYPQLTRAEQDTASRSEQSEEQASL